MEQAKQFFTHLLEVWSMKIFQHKDFDFTTIICNLKEAFQDYQKNNKTSTKGYKEYRGAAPQIVLLWWRLVQMRFI